MNKGEAWHNLANRVWMLGKKLGELGKQSWNVGGGRCVQRRGL
jgi:hypothetical protein